MFSTTFSLGNSRGFYYICWYVIDLQNNNYICRNKLVTAQCPDVKVCNAQDGYAAAEVLVEVDHGIGRGGLQGAGIGGDGLAEEGMVGACHDLGTEIRYRDVAGTGQGLRAFVKEGFEFFRDGGVFRRRPAAGQGLCGGDRDNRQERQERKDQGDDFLHGYFFLSTAVFPATLIQTPGHEKSSRSFSGTLRNCFSSDETEEEVQVMARVADDVHLQDAAGVDVHAEGVFGVVMGEGDLPDGPAVTVGLAGIGEGDPGVRQPHMVQGGLHGVFPAQGGRRRDSGHTACQGYQGDHQGCELLHLLFLLRVCGFRMLLRLTSFYTQRKGKVAVILAFMEKSAVKT